MIEFVSIEANKKNEPNKVSLETLAISADAMYKYAKNLKQPPQLNHFVPAVFKDGNWRVLEKPIDMYYTPEYDCQKYPQECFENDKLEYENALNDVIFSDWEVDYKTSDCIVLRYGDFVITIRDLDTSNPKTSVADFTFSDPIEKDNPTYSDLTKYNLPLNEKGCEKFNL